VLRINQLGDMITDDPDVDPSLYDTSTLTVPKVIFIKPSEAETILIEVGMSSLEIGQAVWNSLTLSYNLSGSFGELMSKIKKETGLIGATV